MTCIPRIKKNNCKFKKWLWIKPLSEKAFFFREFLKVWSALSNNLENELFLSSLSQVYPFNYQTTRQQQMLCKLQKETFVFTSFN